MKKEIGKIEILASSSGWLAFLLNSLPGVGTGYIYQRRWFPYFLNVLASTIWFFLGIYFLKGNEPTNDQKIIGLLGFLLISIITSIESLLAHKRSLKMIEEESNNSNFKDKNKKSWFSK